MRDLGATRIYAKSLAPNDNSKNQVYLGGDFSALNVLPHGAIQTDETEVAGSVRDRAKAPIEFYWIDAAGRHLAPNAGVILYPKYPEVRLSGFLLGCREAPSKVMTVRDEGRVLVFGVTATGAILGFAAASGSSVAREVLANEWTAIGVFHELPIATSSQSPRQMLLDQLRSIYLSNWIPSQKLSAKGIKEPYNARNGGGYTLEAELGVSPNGRAEPDYLGWEIKQFGVSDFRRFSPNSPVTLMTPEPSGGEYREVGMQGFIRKYGYPDQSGKVDRLNFGGRYDCQRGHHHLTNLKMTLSGYDCESGKITDLGGSLCLVTKDEKLAAEWSFSRLMEHWNRKHAQAAYIPSLFQTPPPEYRFGPQILLCEGTDFLMFLKAFAEGAVYYDPALKLEKASSERPSQKGRSQFRVAHKDLPNLYKQHEIVTL